MPFLPGPRSLVSDFPFFPIRALALREARARMAVGNDENSNRQRSHLNYTGDRV